MVDRRRLPDRRPCLTIGLEHEGIHYTASCGFFSDGTLAEIFFDTRKGGSSLNTSVRDAGVLISLCLQNGCSTETIAHALSRNSDGSASGVIGAALDKIAAELQRGGR